MNRESVNGIELVVAQVDLSENPFFKRVQSPRPWYVIKREGRYRRAPGLYMLKDGTMSDCGVMCNTPLEGYWETLGEAVSAVRQHGGVVSKVEPLPPESDGDPATENRNNMGRDRVIAMAHERDEFAQLEDGFYYWWPPKTGGAIAAHELRWIADELTAMNRDWEETIEKELSALPGASSPDVFVEGDSNKE